MFVLCFVLLFVTGECQVDLSGSSRNFSIELLYFTAAQTDGHVVISPFGVWTLMTGITLGATDNSNDELRKAFFLPANASHIVEGYDKLSSVVLNPKTNGVSMTSRNFMFLDNDFHVYEDFTRMIQENFEASIKKINFKDPVAARIANNYIEKSGGRVSNVLASEDFENSKMILTNVISFKGLWSFPFNQSDTTLEPFYNENKEQIGEVNMMYQRAEIPFSSVPNLKGFVIELPYSDDGKYSMLIMLPHNKVKTIDMYKNLAKIGLREVIDKLMADIDDYGLENIDVRIPRFKITTNVVLNKPLNDMGVYDIFDPELASFKRLSRDPLFVSAIVHKADIEVTESGTIASAATSATFADRISTPSFIANKPFVYFVIEKQTTTVIFAGIYSKPTVF